MSIKKNINVAVAGNFETDTGQKTKTLLEQISHMKNISLRAFYNENIEVARKIIIDANLVDSFTDSINNNRKSDEGYRVYTDKIDTFMEFMQIDLMIISELNTRKAIEIIYRCLENKINIVNLNAVSDVTFGLLFKKLARKNGVIYSVGAGDEPAVTLEIINTCELLGFDIICAGKGKNNPMKVECVPADFEDLSKKTDVSASLFVSFVDGTKTMLEMSILSNATGFQIDKDGMHGMTVSLEDVLNFYCNKSSGGIFETTPVIDYTIGNMAPGVFVIISSNQKSIINEMQYLKIGNGPNFILFKPYHLGNIEAPLSIYEIIYNKKPSLVTKDKLTTMVVGKAKSNLKSGNIIENIGGKSFYGFAVSFDKAINNNYAPIGLIEGAKLNININMGNIIRMNDLEIIKNDFNYNLWNKQVNQI